MGEESHQESLKKSSRRVFVGLADDFEVSDFNKQFLSIGANG